MHYYILTLEYTCSGIHMYSNKFIPIRDISILSNILVDLHEVHMDVVQWKKRQTLKAYLFIHIRIRGKANSFTICVRFSENARDFVAAFQSFILTNILSRPSTCTPDGPLHSCISCRVTYLVFSFLNSVKF